MNDKLLEMNNLLVEMIETTEDINELEALLLEVFNLDQRALKNFFISDVKIKTKSSTKVLKEIYKGQLFEIFLEKAKVYTYGVIVNGDIRSNKYSEILIGYLNVFSQERVPLEELYLFIKNKNFHFFANTGIFSIKNRKWELVSNITFEIFSDNELKNIPFKTYFMGKYYKSIGDSEREIADCEVIGEKEASTIMNPLGIIGDQEIENILYELYLKKL